MTSIPAAPMSLVREARLPDPLEALDRLGDAGHPFLRLAAGPGARGTPWSFLGVAPEAVHVVGPRAVSRPLTERLAPLRPTPLECRGPRIPFRGGWAGQIGYEARSGVEATPPPRRPPLGFPVIWLGWYPAVLAWNHATGTSYVASLGATPRECEERVRDLRARLRTARPPPGRASAAAPRAQMSRAAYLEVVRRTRRHVRAGDLFQANVSQRFDARFEGRAIDLFQRLARAQPAPYMTYLDLGRGRAILSASPERFLRVRGRTVETDPMKGTRPRGVTPADDRRLRRELEVCEKERAELAMIVDLSRNDLSRACVAGSIRVAVARRLLRFPRVHQAIGVVRGRLRPGLDRVDLLQATFPPGSVTGAPKIRAMEILDALEGEGRGPYCGALGWFDPRGDMDLSVAIRTIALGGRTARYRVGGGVTLRSDPEAEWRETLAKGRGLFAALAMREDAT